MPNDISESLNDFSAMFMSMGQQLSGAINAVSGFVSKLAAAAEQVAVVLITPMVKLTAMLLAPIGAVVAGLMSLVGGLLSSAFSAIMESTVVQSVVIPTLVTLAASLGLVLIPLLAVAGALAAVAAVILSVVVVALAALAAAVLAVAAIIAAPFAAAALLFTAALSAMTAPLALVGSAAAMATGPFLALGAAASAVTAPFQMLGNALGPFVSALNPSVMEAFNFALKGLQATIGVALLPVIQVFTVSMRQVAGALLPLMQQMAPVLEVLANALTSVLLVAVQSIADVFVALMPLIAFAVDLFSALAEAFKIFLIVVRTLVQTVLAMVGGGELKDVAAQLRKVLLDVVKYLVAFAVNLAKLLGMKDFASSLSKNLGESAAPKAGGAAPAPEGVGIKGFDQIAKDMAVMAAGAMGGSGKDSGKEQIDYIKELRDMLAGMEKNDPKVYFKEIADGLQKAGEKALRDLLTSGENKVKAGYENAKQFIVDHLPKLPGGASLEKGAHMAGQAAAAVFPGAGLLFGH